MGLFVEIHIEDELCIRHMEDCLRCILLCPVAIFAEEGRRLVVNEERVDECILCELCLLAAPAGAIRLVKKYSGELLVKNRDSAVLPIGEVGSSA